MASTVAAKIRRFLRLTGLWGRQTIEDMARATPFGSILLLALTGSCVDVPPDQGEAYPPVQSEACEDLFTAAPRVRVGAWSSGLVPFEDDVLPIHFGSGNGGGCGYHIEFAVETEQLCEVLYVRTSIDLLGIDGDRMVDFVRHVQFVRADPTVETRQVIWDMRASIPREHYPNDPEHADECPEDSGSAGHCDEFEFLLEVEVEDHGGRIATTERVLRPSCCI